MHEWFLKKNRDLSLIWLTVSKDLKSILPQRGVN